MISIALTTTGVPTTLSCLIANKNAIKGTWMEEWLDKSGNNLKYNINQWERKSISDDKSCFSESFWKKMLNQLKCLCLMLN